MPIVSRFPAEILTEILSYILVDTPKAAHKAAVLRTCTTLLNVGRPLLYRVVDLQDLPDFGAILSAWTTLFGPGGLLAGGRNDIHNLHERVQLLRVGGPKSMTDEDVPQLVLWKCTCFYTAVLDCDAHKHAEGSY